jgi:uncharacterized protein YodC (DUF2158 family)
VSAVTEERDTFDVGSVVELKSGGPAMTIREIAGNLVDCEWFKDGNLKSATFERHSLKRKAKTHEEWLKELSKNDE